MKKILIVDDETDFRAQLINILKKEGYETIGASSAKEACEHLSLTAFDIVLLDYVMPKKSGIDALGEIKRLRPRVKVIMITAFASPENAVEAVKKGVSDYISKPFKVDALLLMIRRLLEEAKFEEGIKKLDLDQTLSTLTNPIRRNILKLLQDREDMHLMEITRELEIEDHTKIVFHLKMLTEEGIINKSPGKMYVLSEKGIRMVECLKMLEYYLAVQ